MVSTDGIEPAKTEWAAPIVFAARKERTLQFCVEYHKLSAVTIQDCCSIRGIDKSIDSFGDSTIFAVLDANSGYGEVKIAFKYP